MFYLHEYIRNNTWNLVNSTCLCADGGVLDIISWNPKGRVFPYDSCGPCTSHSRAKKNFYKKKGSVVFTLIESWVSGVKINWVNSECFSLVILHRGKPSVNTVENISTSSSFLSRWC